MNQESEQLELSDKVWIASKIFSSIQQFFAHWEAVADLDVEQAYREYLQTAIHSSDRLSFDLASLEFMAKLKNGHTFFEDTWLWNKCSKPIGFSLSKVSNAWIVTRSQIDPLQVGEIVLQIAGVSVDEFIIDRGRYIASSSDMARQIALFKRPYLFPNEFLLNLSNGKEVPINRNSQKLNHTESKSVDWKILPKRIGYLKIPSFQSTQFEEAALSWLAKNSDVSALIIDVRGNDGGVTPQKLIDAVMDRPYQDWSSSTSISIGLFSAYQELAKGPNYDQLDERAKGYLSAFSDLGKMNLTMPGKPTTSAKPIYQGPILVLTDNHTASAAEDFVMPLKTSGRAQVIGQSTWGSSGQPYCYSFGNGMSIYVGSKRMFFPDGRPFEGIGIHPNVLSEPSLEDIRSNIDVTLNKAIEIASSL